MILKKKSPPSLPAIASKPEPADGKLGRLLTTDEIASADRFDLEEASRMRAQSAYLGEKRLLARMLGRYKIFLDSHDRGFASHVTLDGYWETWLTQFIANRIRRGMVAVDVGANFGYYSVLMADLVGETGKLYAIEPNPDAVSHLIDTLAINGFRHRASVFNLASGATADKALLRVPKGEPKNASILAAGEPLDGTKAVYHEVTVQALDETLAKEPRVDFLKIDAEGAEEDIVLGAQRTLERHRPDMVLEFNPERCKSPGALLSQLRVWYPTLRLLHHDGKAVPATDTELLESRSNEDSLIYLTTRAELDDRDGGLSVA